MLQVVVLASTLHHGVIVLMHAGGRRVLGRAEVQLTFRQEAG